MQITTALAIALFGFTSATVAVSPVPGPSRATDPSAAGCEGMSEATKIRVVENVHQWYNELYSDVLAIDGEWEELVIGEKSVLRPSGEHCSILLRPRWKDEVVYFPVAPKGEVTLDRGWIRINQLSQSALSAAAAAPAAVDCDTEYYNDTVVMAEFGGDCWDEADPAQGCSAAWACSGSGSEGCTLEITLDAGIPDSSTAFYGDCGSEFTVSDCDDGKGGNGILCINLP